MGFDARSMRRIAETVVQHERRVRTRQRPRRHYSPSGSAEFISFKVAGVFDAGLGLNEFSTTNPGYLRFESYRGSQEASGISHHWFETDPSVGNFTVSEAGVFLLMGSWKILQKSATNHVDRTVTTTTVNGHGHQVTVDNTSFAIQVTMTWEKKAAPAGWQVETKQEIVLPSLHDTAKSQNQASSTLVTLPRGAQLRLAAAFGAGGASGERCEVIEGEVIFLRLTGDELIELATTG